MAVFKRAGLWSLAGQLLTLLIQKMEQAGEMGEIGRGARHEGVLQSGGDTGEHKTIDSEKEEQFRVQVCSHLQV